MTDPIIVDDDDIEPDTTDPEPDESPKNDPVPED